MSLKTLFQGPASLDKLRRRLADHDAQAEAARQQRRGRALEAVLGDEPATQELVAEELAEQAERNVLIDALAEAERLEQERIEAARTEQERADAEAEVRERKARFRASVQYLSRVQRGAEAAAIIINDLAAVAGEMRAGMASYHGLFNGAYPYRAFDIDGLIANELARAGRKHGVEIPGAVGDGGDATLTAAVKGWVKVLTHRAEQMLVRGQPDPTEPPPPPRVVEPPTPPRRARLSYIECEALRMSGRDPSAVIFVPQTGRSYRREQLQAEFGWTFDAAGNPVTWSELPVEAPAPPPGRDDAAIREQQAKAGQAADRALLRSRGFAVADDGRVIGRAVEPEAAPAPTPPASADLPVIDAALEMARASPIAADPEFAALQARRHLEMEARHVEQQNAVAVEPATGSSAKPADVGAAILTAPDAATAVPPADEVY